MWANTRLSLLATAGLRKMTSPEQKWILAESFDILNASEFSVGEVKILSGDEEALYDWLAVISAHRVEGQDMFLGGASRGVIDMGGESQQIAFTIKELPVNTTKDSDIRPSSAFLKSHCSPRWMVQLPDQPEAIKLYSRSYSGFGLISSMNIIAQTYHDMWYDNLTNEAKCPLATCEVKGADEENMGENSDFLSSKDITNCRCEESDVAERVGGSVSIAGGVDIVEIPPLHPHLRYHNPCYAPGVFPPGNSHDLDYDLNGAGNFSLCLELIREIFTPKIPEMDIMCIKVSLWICKV